MELTYALLAIAYVLLVEFAPVPQIIKLAMLKESDQVSLLFTFSLTFGRLLAVPYAFQKEALIVGWGLLAGALLRIVLLAQSMYYQRRAARMKRLREEEVTI